MIPMKVMHNTWLIDTLRKSGIIIGEPSYLGASPDGVLLDESHQVIGRYTGNQMPIVRTVSEACEQFDNFYLTKKDDKFALKSNHVYFYQV